MRSKLNKEAREEIKDAEVERMHPNAEGRLVRYLEEEVFPDRTAMEIEEVVYDKKSNCYVVCYSWEDENCKLRRNWTKCRWRANGEGGSVLEDFVSEDDPARQEEYDRWDELNLKVRASLR